MAANDWGMLESIAVGAIGATAYAWRWWRRRVHNLQYELANREREKLAVFDFLNRIGEQVTRRVDLQGTMELVLSFLQDTTTADAAAIFLRSNDDPTVLKAAVVQGMFPPLHKTSSDRLLARRRYVAEVVKRDTLRVGEGIVGRVAETGKGMLVTDAARDERVPREASEIIPIRDLIIAPLTVRDEVLGVLVLVNKRENGPFSESDWSLVNAIADQAAATLDLVRLYGALAEKQRIEQELRVAKGFQEMLLPRTVPQLDNIEVAGFSRSALEVGGDYYDYVEVDDDHIGIVVADVSGKGIPGALVMAGVRATLRAEARGDLSPKSGLRRVNSRTMADTELKVFVTAIYGVLNIRTGVFRYARAGHEPLLTCEPGVAQPTRHEPKGIALGLVDGDFFDVMEEEEIDLRSSGTVVIYTDGVIDAMDGLQEYYGEDRFVAVLQESASKQPDGVIGDVIADIEEFAGNRDQHDDITIVVFRWKQPKQSAADAPSAETAGESRGSAATEEPESAPPAQVTP